MKSTHILTFLLVLALCVLFPAPLQAKVIYFGSETETVTLVYGNQTLFRFGGEVRTVSQASRFDISPANSDQPSYSLLSIKPRFSTGSSEVVFILADGTTIKTKLVTVSNAIPEKTDSIYDFKSKDSLVNEADGGKSGSSLSELALMKAMIRGDQVTGYEVKNISRSISPGFKGIETRLIRLYTGNQYNGYIFELTNVTKAQRLLVTIQNLMLGDPNVAILSMIDQPVLESKGSEQSKTYLRIVSKPSSLYNQLILPVQVVEKRESK